MSEPSPFYGLRPIKGLAEEWSINYRSLYHICRKHEIQATKIICNSRLYGPDEQRAMFAVLQEYGHGLGIDLALYKSLPALDEEVCETEGRHQVWTSHLLQRHEEAIKTLKAEREDFKGRLERLESGNPYTALLGALGKFTETHLCPASLGQWNQMLLTLPQGAITNALRIFQALFADALDLNLALLDQGALTGPDTGRLLDILQCLGEQLGPRALAQRQQIMEAVPAEDAATDLNFDAPF